MWDKNRDNTRDNMRAKFWGFCLFYKDYLNSGSTLELDEYYKKIYKNEKESNSR